MTGVPGRRAAAAPPSPRLPSSRANSRSFPDAAPGDSGTERSEFRGFALATEVNLSSRGRVWSLPEIHLPRPEPPVRCSVPFPEHPPPPSGVTPGLFSKTAVRGIGEGVYDLRFDGRLYMT